ncbi:hypothetical protein EWM62_15565 [Mucilaginibacter terrigena]|uniref:Uncharacterized protein n=1 Tax=Mucilaginibacter terrigena TaxID=2492395 RepID=A0A4V1ZBI9_9SPHI|nr:hypothetical protein EWM62_15565 [Mucilaginibacter terrigena]
MPTPPLDGRLKPPDGLLMPALPLDGRLKLPDGLLKLPPPPPDGRLTLPPPPPPDDLPPPPPPPPLCCALAEKPKPRNIIPLRATLNNFLYPVFILKIYNRSVVNADVCIRLRNM